MVFLIKSPLIPTICPNHCRHFPKSLFQKFAKPPEISSKYRQNFDSIGIYEQPGDEKINLALQWLNIIGLKDQAQASFRSLSFGQQRLLLIIRSLVKQPPLLILDEPLQGLDGLSRELVRRFVEFLMKNGSTQLLFVSHHVEDAPRGIRNIINFKDNGTRTFDIEVQHNIRN